MTNKEIQKLFNLKEEITKLIDHHESMKNSYFWSSPSNARSRRAYEEKHTNEYSFKYDGDEIRIYQKCSCSCKNIYYYQTIYYNGYKKDVRLLKKIVKNINSKLVYVNEFLKSINDKNILLASSLIETKKVNKTLNLDGETFKRKFEKLVA